MNSKKDRISARQISRPVSRGGCHVPRVSDSLRVLEDSCDGGSFESFDATHYALQTLNKHIERRLAKLQANTIRLKRELWLLQRHIKEFRHPLFENWEADMLTRLIEVAHAHQHKKLPGGVVIGEFSFAERENLNHAYSIAAKAIRMPTLRKLGLSEKYHQALQRYSEVAPYRSPNPFQTEFAFAKWLVEVRDDRPELYGFWSKLFPVCYDRSVQESASIF